MDVLTLLSDVLVGSVAKLSATQPRILRIVKPDGTVEAVEVKRLVLEKVVNYLGLMSAVAQELSTPITTLEKLEDSNTQNLYLIADQSMVVGFLKVGRKKLFIIDDYCVQNEVSPLCILDFYVHESRQRQGFGKKIFDFMLQQCKALLLFQNEDVQPQHLAIDRPSIKLLSFLEKYYMLSAKIPQANNFVVFDGFFDCRPDPAKPNTRDRLLWESTSAMSRSPAGSPKLRAKPLMPSGGWTPAPVIPPHIQNAPLNKRGYGTSHGARNQSSLAEILHHDSTGETLKQK
ncbi:unnamed protein product [Cyprideis torosa]|uniref:Alpha-tubulin N-acetyltransferase n=1 Tax=Cyprideis torosa TaxID=163714 RepID=A0A7R8ZGT9_9CRUS|nr:unnamed protein product [Cyprideis torosa]CAG0882166.1 unnamed protein product [Cyprideis torosa]